MELFEAIKTRKSVRAFEPKAVPTETIMEVLEIATRAPSSVNSQPWEFFIVKGAKLDQLKNRCVEQLRQGIGPGPDVPLPDKTKGDMGLQGIYKKRQVVLGVTMFKLLGIAKGDQKAIMDYMVSMYRFFDAPAVVIIAVDKVLQLSYPLIDIGALLQTIALAALEFDLGTCIMRAIADYPEQVREIVGIPESKHVIIGMTMGYPDWDHPINKFQSEREALADLLTVVE
ncbi:MAG: nitroreductase [Deltaproteobacteria bacterium]|nr:nitroreductase [Deltaproteobacteria bacterium]